MRWNLIPVLAGLLWPAVGMATPLIPPVRQMPESYELVYEDEFTQPELNFARWNTTMAFAGTEGARYHNTSYLHYVQDDDVLLEDGILRLRAMKRAVIGEEPPGTYAFTAGLVTTHDKFSFRYGYIEIRAKYPGGPGVWPAFWLIGEEQHWPPEFDIAEYYGGSGVMHYGLCHGTLKNVQWDSTGDKNSGAEEGWHTYALDWRPGQAVWLVDGVVKKVVTADYVPNIPMYIILSNGVSSRFGPSGVPDDTTPFPNYLEVDYVRVWQSPAQQRKSAPLLPPIIATPGGLGGAGLND